MANIETNNKNPDEKIEDVNDEEEEGDAGIDHISLALDQLQQQELNTMFSIAMIRRDLNDMSGSTQLVKQLLEKTNTILGVKD